MVNLEFLEMFQTCSGVRVSSAAIDEHRRRKWRPLLIRFGLRIEVGSLKRKQHRVRYDDSVKGYCLKHVCVNVSQFSAGT